MILPISAKYASYIASVTSMAFTCAVALAATVSQANLKRGLRFAEIEEAIPVSCGDMI